MGTVLKPHLSLSLAMRVNMAPTWVPELIMSVSTVNLDITVWVKMLPTLQVSAKRATIVLVEPSPTRHMTMDQLQTTTMQVLLSRDTTPQRALLNRSSVLKAPILVTRVVATATHAQPATSVTSWEPPKTRVLYKDLSAQSVITAHHMIPS